MILNFLRYICYIIGLIFIIDVDIALLFLGIFIIAIIWFDYKDEKKKEGKGE